MAVLGWVTALGALWIACAWGVATVVGGVIVRSRADRRVVHAPVPVGPVPRPRGPHTPGPHTPGRHTIAARVVCTSGRTVHRGRT